MNRRTYPTDLKDAEWGMVSPLLPEAKPGGRPRSADLRETRHGSTSRTSTFTERLWRSVKYEEVYLHDYTTPREARAGLSRYLSLYNHERPHQALNYLTPAEIYFRKGEPPTLNLPPFLF